MNVYWLEQEFADVLPGDTWLSAGEKAILKAMRFSKRRADWLLGRWTAKRAIAVHHPRTLESIEIRAARSGAPEVFVAGEPGPVTISISHREGRAACAVALCRAALGCDLEMVQPHSAAFANDYFTTEEQALVANAPAKERPLLLTLLWSAKESVLKALEQGLRLDTRSVVVTPQHTGNAWHPFKARYADRQWFHGWWRESGNLVRTIAADLPLVPPVTIPHTPYRFSTISSCGKSSSV